MREEYERQRVEQHRELKRLKSQLRQLQDTRGKYEEDSGRNSSSQRSVQSVEDSSSEDEEEESTGLA